MVSALSHSLFSLGEACRLIVATFSRTTQLKNQYRLRVVNTHHSEYGDKGWRDSLKYSPMICAIARLPEQGIAAAKLFRGFGAMVAKSLELFCVLVQPFERRITAMALPGAGAGPAPRKQLAVLP